jgi:hypothetical protein
VHENQVDKLETALSNILGQSELSAANVLIELNKIVLLNMNLKLKSKLEESTGLRGLYLEEG